MNSTALKDVDSNLYRKFRALAKLKGITIKEALEEAIKIWIQLNSHILREKYIDIVIEYLRRCPVEPFVFKTKEPLIKQWNSWARRKLGIKH